MEASSRRSPPCCVNNKCEHLKDLIYKSYALPFLVECSKSPPSHTTLPLCPLNFHQNMWDCPWRYRICLGTISPFWLGCGSDQKIQCISPPHPPPTPPHPSWAAIPLGCLWNLAISVQWVGEPQCNSDIQKWREKERAVQYLHPTPLTHLRGALPFPTQPQSQRERRRARDTYSLYAATQHNTEWVGTKVICIPARSINMPSHKRLVVWYALLMSSSF